jgi:NADPH:quinone reductase-like Zn-dependent oxidoreductase
MTYVYAVSQDAGGSLAGLSVVEEPPAGAARQEIPAGWVRVRVRAATLNHHDLWSLRGVGLKHELLPMVLGTDAAGVDDAGNEVIVHCVIASDGFDGDETLDPRRSILSERFPGTLAPAVWVPARNLVPKDPALSWAEAASLPTAYLTAYRMLFTAGELRPGQTVLIQGAGGGVATAAILLGRAAGLRVWVTGRDPGRRARAVELGAHQAFEAGARLPEQVDAVIEVVGQATWAHSLKALRPGGVAVVAGATTGDAPPADLSRVFFRALRVHGVTTGTRAELAALQSFLVGSGIRPAIDSTRPMAHAAEAFARLASGQAFGKVVLTQD